MADLLGRPIIFGEVLFDQFQDGSSVLGGAPFNVAWHLQGFGIAPVFVSRVGNDALGGQVRRAMSEWGMDLRGLQEDPDYSTGTVQVQLVDGQPSYEIVPDQAYDFVDASAALAALDDVRPALLCHGSLAARTAQSRHALEALRQWPDLPSFVDINIRHPWWSQERGATLLQGASWLKLNADELAILLEREPVPDPELAAEAERLRALYDLRFVLLTLGASGATLVTDEASHFAEPKPVEEFVDAVGAGDAFTSVIVLGLLSGWTPNESLVRAVEFAAAVCGIRGATVTDRNLYERHLREWGV